MNQDNAARPSVGKIVAGTVLALALGFLQPQILTIQLLTFNFCAASVIGVALYVWAGIIPAVVLAIAATANTFAGFGPLMGTALLPMTLLPPALIVWNACRKLPFFQQMQRGLIAFLGGTAATALLVALLFGGDIVGQIAAIMRSVFDEAGTEFWKLIEPRLTALDPTVTFETFAELFDDIVSLIQAYYELYLLANMLAGAAVSAIVAVFWGNWLLARRGEATPDSFVGLHDWFLPANLTWGTLMTLLAAWIVTGTAIPGGAIAWCAVSALAQVAFVVQALAACDRRIKARGATRGRRTATVVLILLAGLIFRAYGTFTFLSLIGCASALFGRRGAARPIVEKLKKTFGGDDR